MIRSPKDFWAGLIYIAFGLGAILIARDYAMGSALKMGPAYFPTILGGLLAVIGALSLVRAFWQDGAPVARFALRGLALVVGSVVVFGALVRGAGLVVALPLLVLISSYASVKFRLTSALALAVALTVFCALVFLKGLGVPLPLRGPWLGG